MTIMKAPPGVIASQTVKLLSGTTYTVDASGFISVTSQVDVVSLQGAMGFLQVDGRSNYVATTDPVVGSDNTLDYAAGSLWINTTASPNRAWICVSAATGAAVWLQISIGALIATANSASFTNATLAGLLTRSSNVAVTAFSGGGQGSATLITTDYANVTTATASSTPYDSVKFSAAMSPGQRRAVSNGTANPVQLFGFNTDTINGFGSSVGVVLPSGFIGIAESFATGLILIRSLPSFTPNFVYRTNTATSGTTLTGANVSGGTVEVTLALTGTLGGAANAQLPTVADLVAAIPNAAAGQIYRIRISNESSANFGWTIITNTGWTLNGTMTIAQNAFRDFYISLQSTSAATIQNLQS